MGQDVLRVVRVLVFVDQQVLQSAPAVPAASADDRESAWAVRSSRSSKSRALFCVSKLLIFRVDARDRALIKIAGASREGLGGNQLVFGVADGAVNGRWGEVRAGNIQRLDRFLDQLGLVGCIKDAEIGRQADLAA